MNNVTQMATEVAEGLVKFNCGGSEINLLRLLKYDDNYYADDTKGELIDTLGLVDKQIEALYQNRLGYMMVKLKQMDDVREASDIFDILNLNLDQEECRFVEEKENMIRAYNKFKLEAGKAMDGLVPQ